MESKNTFIEVCAGAGGLSSGLMKAGFVPLLLNDNNKDCCETLKKNHSCNVVCSNMTELDLSEYINRVDLLCGGVPCQSFSQAGNRKGFDDVRGGLMMEFIKLIRSIKPKLFLVENVKGLLTHNKGETMKTIISAMTETEEYNVVYKCLDASRYNVPQKRERVFIIGKRNTNTKPFVFPKEGERTVLRGVLDNVPKSPCAKYSEEKINLFRMIPQGGCWVNLPENLQKQYLGKSYNSGGGKRGILHRLSFDKPCLTLLCSPSQKQTERCHPLEERPLSIREYARIQTFDDSYEFVGSVSSQYKQIGNAVPVELARRVGEAILECINSS